MCWVNKCLAAWTMHEKAGWGRAWEWLSIML